MTQQPLLLNPTVPEQTVSAPTDENVVQGERKEDVD